MTTIASRRSATSPAARFAACYIAMLGAHNVADYWAQTTHQAANKGRHGSVHESAVGHRACLAHVAVYTVSGTITVCAANKILSLDATWRSVLTGQFISATSHAIRCARWHTGPVEASSTTATAARCWTRAGT